MNIDDASLVNLKVYQIEQFINSILIIAKNKSKELSLNPNSFKQFIYAEYVNSLRIWRSTDKFSSNPNPFFPKYDIHIKDYQKYHEYVMNLIEEFVCQNKSKDVLLLKDLLNYLKETNLNDNNNFVLYNNLSKLEKQYQMHILNQVVLATYEGKGYQSVISAFENLLINNSYKGFSRHRMKGLYLPDDTNYRKLMTQNIEKDEVTNLINSCMLRFNLNYKYQFVPDEDFFKKYVDKLIYTYKTQLFDQLVISLSNELGVEECVEKINSYMKTKNEHELLVGNQTEMIINHYKIRKYLNSKFIIKYLQSKVLDYSLEAQDLISEYVNMAMDSNHKTK